MRFQFVEVEKACFTVAVVCEVLDVSRSASYAWRSRRASSRTQDDQMRVVAIATAHVKIHKRYGSPRVHRALRDE